MKRKKNASAKLVIDLARIRPQEQSSVQCSYKHHPENRGFDAVLERVRFALICRRCESAPCVAACPRGALEKVQTEGNGTGVLKRANMLCTGCGTCAIACPFGTVDGDLMPFASSVCDTCKGRLQPGEKPLCVQTCSDGSIDYRPLMMDGSLMIDPDKKQSSITNHPSSMVELLPDIVVAVADGCIWKPVLKDVQEAGKR
jgi:Fe-S-cluster-containing dehydrogenase component